MYSSFHLVSVSLWPMLNSFVIWSLLVFSVFWWHYGVSDFFFFALFTLVFTMFCWWYDVLIEKNLGFHSSKVSLGFRYGMIFFMISEVFFFVSFFWGYFHKCWSPSIEMNVWPPYGFVDLVMDPFSVPLLNTVLLLSSGVSMTFCHHSMVGQLFNGVLVGFIITLFFGFFFIFVQASEYAYGYFSMNSSMYGTTFFLLTGFHGMHVLVGVSMILFNFFRFVFSLDFSNVVHVGFEAAVWYWHFVDVVWMFLFFFVYWYGF